MLGWSGPLRKWLEQNLEGDEVVNLKYVRGVAGPKALKWEIICSMNCKQANLFRIERPRSRGIKDEFREVLGTGSWRASYAIVKTLDFFWRKLGTNSRFCANLRYD